MKAGVGAVLEPLVEAGLEVLGRGEGAARFEVGAQEAVGALEDALGLGVGGLADRPADRQGAAEGGEGLGRACPSGRSPPRGPRPRSAAARPASPGSGPCPRGCRAPAWRRSAPRRRRARSPGRWSRPSLCVSARGRRGSPPAAPRGRTGRSPRGGRRCAGRCAWGRSAGDLAQVVVEDRLAALSSRALRSARGCGCRGSGGRSAAGARSPP